MGQRQDDVGSDAEHEPGGAGRPVAEIRGIDRAELSWTHSMAAIARAQGGTGPGGRGAGYDGVRVRQSPIAASRRCCCVAAPASSPWPRSWSRPITLSRWSTGLWSSYLNLASTRSTVSRIPRIPDSIRPYGAVPTATAARSPSGWMSANWAVRMSTLPWVVDDGGPAHELHSGVVAGRRAVLVRAAGLGPPVGRDVGVVADHGQPDLGRRLQVRPDRVRPGQVQQDVVPGEGEVGGQHQRGRRGVEIVDHEHPEPVGGCQPVVDRQGLCT